MRLNQTSPVEGFLLRSGKLSRDFKRKVAWEETRRNLTYAGGLLLVGVAIWLLFGNMVARARSEETYKALCAEAADEALERAGVRQAGV